MNLIARLRNVSCRLGKRAVLRNLDLELAPDTLTVVLGENGSGKTTLLRCLVGLLPIAEGELCVLGHDPRRGGPAFRELVAYVPDQSDACQWMTAGDLFRFVGAQTPRWEEALAARLAGQMNVPLDIPLARLSRGQSAKACLVTAVASRPLLLALDEPLARLSPPARADVLRVLASELPLPGGAVVLATHDLDVATRLADRVICVNDGRVETAITSAAPELHGFAGFERLRHLYSGPIAS